MNQDDLKQAVAAAALDYVEEHSIVGVGTGSTVNFFVEALASIKHDIEGAVASSVATEKRLKDHGIPVIDFNSVSNLELYVDGADAATKQRVLVKGGGGALTREKILATAAKQFICILDESKLCGVLGEFPIPIEVIPMARSFVAREIVKLNGNPVYRENFITDNGNIILDVYNWELLEPMKMEVVLNNIPGVVSNGIFAARIPEILLIATQSGMKVLGANQLLINKLLK